MQLKGEVFKENSKVNLKIVCAVINTKNSVFNSKTELQLKDSGLFKLNFVWCDELSSSICSAKRRN